MVEGDGGLYIEDAEAVDAGDTLPGRDVDIQLGHLVREGKIYGNSLLGLVGDGSKHKVAGLVGSIGSLVRGHRERSPG